MLHGHWQRIKIPTMQAILQSLQPRCLLPEGKHKTSQSIVFCINLSWQLPDEFAHFATQRVGGKGPKKPFLAHCRRECFHAQVEVLLDDEFH
jgi:hypothetical protein